LADAFDQRDLIGTAVNWACGWPTIKSFLPLMLSSSRRRRPRLTTWRVALKGYAGIIVSAMVPGAGGYELKRDDGTSAAEQLARLVPKGRVVAAFTSISSALIRDPASGEKPTVFTCADDEAARSIVIALAKEIGFEGVDAGHLDASRNIENLGLLVGQLAYGSGFGNRVKLRAYVAPRPVRRARPGKGSTVPKRRRNP
jgi:hypothetical protein